MFWRNWSRVMTETGTCWSSSSPRILTVACSTSSISAATSGSMPVAVGCGSLVLVGDPSPVAVVPVAVAGDLVLVALASGVLVASSVGVASLAALVAIVAVVAVGVVSLPSSESPRLQALSSRRHTSPNVKKADLIGQGAPVNPYPRQ